MILSLLYIFCIQSRELEIDIMWHDYRSLCAIKFLRLEDFLDNQRHGLCLQLEPEGMLFAEVSARRDDLYTWVFIVNLDGLWVPLWPVFSTTLILYLTWTKCGLCNTDQCKEPDLVQV